MAGLKTSSLPEQVAAHLRDEIRAGRWKGVMPGRRQLAQALEASPCTVQRALEILDCEGLLVPQGGGKRRRIVLEPGGLQPRAARIGFLPFGRGSAGKAFMVDIRHQLIEAGHGIEEPPQTLYDLGMEVPRIARMVKQYEVDAWIVVAASAQVLEWFAAQPTPVFAFFGGYHELPIAGCKPLKKPAFVAAMNRLISLGHRRIVFLLRSHLKSPPCMDLGTFWEVMESHGIAVGHYNVPDWGGDNPEAFHRCLDSLVATTPPTALIVDEAEQFLAARQHLADRGFVVPEHVSLICTDPDRAFSWYRPAISHISWSADPMVRRVVRWVNNIRLGKDDRRKTRVTARFIEGGTIGPAPKER